MFKDLERSKDSGEDVVYMRDDATNKRAQQIVEDTLGSFDDGHFEDL